MSKPDADTGKEEPARHGGLTLEQYADVIAHLLHFADREPPDVLARFGLNEKSFRPAEMGWRFALVEDSMQFRTRTLKTFTKRVKAVQKTLEEEQPPLDEIGTVLGAEAESSSPAIEPPPEEPVEEAEPAPEEPATAEPPPPPAEPERAPELPSYAIAEAKAAWVPPPSGIPTSPEPPAPVSPAEPIPRPALVDPPAMVVEPPAIVAAEIEDEPTRSPELERLETVTFEAPDAATQPSSDVLPFKANERSDSEPPELKRTTTAITDPPTVDRADEPPPLQRTSTVIADVPVVDPQGKPPRLTRTRTVASDTPVSQKALPFEPPPPPPEAPSELEPTPGANAQGGDGMTLEQYASLCAELAVNPAQSSEIEKRYGLNGDSLREVDASFRKRFAEAPELQAKFDQLSQRFRAWLEKDAT